MRQGKYISAELLAETRSSFIAQGVPVDEGVLVEVAATLARLAPSYVDEDARLRHARSSVGGT